MTLPISAKPSLVYYCLDATPFIGALKNLYDLFFLYIHKAPSPVPPQSYHAHVLRKGAEKGNVSSMTKLGQILLYSHEKKDKVEGYQWLQQAATDPIEPSGEAMVRIARLFDQDETKAKAWAQKARETIKDEKDRFYKKAGKILGILV